MLTRNEILKMLVGLQEINDPNLIHDDAVLAENCLESDNVKVRAMAALVEDIYRRFDYASSPEFLRRINGKSEQHQTMHRKLLDNVKLREAKQRLGASMTRILETDDVYDLVAVTDHHCLDQLKELAESLTDPGP